MEEFIYIIRPRRPGFIDEPTPEEDAIVKTHFEYLKSGHQAGIVTLAGRCLDQSFGVVIFQAETEQAAHEFMTNDPAVRERVMTAELFPFRVALVK